MVGGVGVARVIRGRPGREGPSPLFFVKGEGGGGAKLNEVGRGGGLRQVVVNCKLKGRHGASEGVRPSPLPLPPNPQTRQFVRAVIR